MKFNRTTYRSGLFCCTILIAASLAGQGLAQTAAAPVASLQEVVVTAQRREQNVQDVPIAVTALTQTSLAVNRVATVNDLNLLAPGFTVVPAAGGTQIPSFSMRGVTSYGVVPGSDKAISVYLDGVYISSPRGSIFDLPDVSQIEVLRGPQGTLFGRNAIGGAVSVTTRDPSGKFGVQQDFSAGNESLFRSRTSIDFPAWGPFSAYVSYVRDTQQGDIRNTGAGTLWHYSNAMSSLIPKSANSPDWLGGTDSNSVFVALKFAPTDNFSTIYKFDYSQDDGTPEGQALLSYDAHGAGPITIGTQPTPVQVDSSGKRPNSVNNAFSVPQKQAVYGQSLTSKYETDHFTIKNIASYRESYIFANDQLDGAGGLVVTPAFALINPAFAFVPSGTPFVQLGLTNLSQSRQWSDELQVNYHSKLLTLTAGGLVFRGKDQSGAVPGLANNVTFAPIFGGQVPAGTSQAYNLGDSIAAYLQAELHVTSQVDIVTGVRETKDWKSGSLILSPGLAQPNFKYQANKPTYLIGVNYKPIQDLMVYAKYSTAFVSGGSVAGIPFAPETVASWEAGLKGEFFDRRLRTNISLYDAEYQHLQDAEGGAGFQDPVLLARYPFIPSLGTFVVDQGGPVHAQGVEFEGTAIVAPGVSLGTNVGYTDTTFKNVNPSLDNPAAVPASPGVAAEPGVPPVPTLLPRWTVGLWGEYVRHFDNGLKGTLRMDADWRSVTPLANPGVGVRVPAYAPFTSIPSTWLVNGRATLGGFKFGPGMGEISLWAKNLTDDRSLNYALLITGLVASGNFQPARTFGVDFHFKY